MNFTLFDLTQERGLEYLLLAITFTATIDGLLAVNT